MMTNIEKFVAMIAIVEGIQAFCAIGVLCYWRRNLSIASEVHEINKEQLEIARANNLRAQELHVIEADYRKAALAKLMGKQVAREGGS